MNIYSGSNIRRTARFFGTAALIAAPLFALLGIAGILGLGWFGGPQPIEVDRSAPAGSPVELTTSVHGEAVWGQPDVDLVRGDLCGLPQRRVERGPARRHGRTDAPPRRTTCRAGRGSGCSTTDGQRASSSVTCSGGGLETVGVTVDPGDGTRGNPGAPFLVFAAFLVVLGLVLRRVDRPAGPLRLRPASGGRLVAERLAVRRGPGGEEHGAHADAGPEDEVDRR